MFDDGGEVRGGSVGQLVLRLTALDPLYMSQFLITFRSFTTTRVLLALLRKIFNRSERAEQLRIVNILRQWIKVECGVSVSVDVRRSPSLSLKMRERESVCVCVCVCVGVGV
jgi:RasGEF N-terminal motif